MKTNNKDFYLIVMFIFYCCILYIPGCAYTPKSADISAGQTKAEASQSKSKKTPQHLWEYKRDFSKLTTINYDVQTGAQMFNEQKEYFLKQNYAVNSPLQENTLNRLQTIVYRLAAVSDNPNLPYEVAIVENDEMVNAYCLPGGKIVVFTGLFQSGMVNINNDNEIAAVLAHEIAHANMRHIARQTKAASNRGFAGKMLSAFFGKDTLEDALVSSVYLITSSLFIPGYERKHEKEADQVGLYYMTKAGYDPQANIDIWVRAAQKNNPGNTKKQNKTAFWASHPADGARANFLRGFYADALEVQKGMQVQVTNPTQSH